MKTHAVLAGAVLALLVSGCKPPPKEESIGSFKKDVRRYFEALNQDALTRKDLLRRQQATAERNPLADAPTGTVLNTFFFDDGGYLVENYTDSAGVVRTVVPRSAGQEPSIQEIATPTATSTGDEKTKVTTIGKDAGAGLDAGSKVKELFELTQDNPEKPLVAKVRYVRRSWVYDPRGAVKLSPTVVTKAAVAVDWIPTEGSTGSWWKREEMYMLPGFHRLDGEFVGEITFQWHGGELTEKSRTAEVPMRPWKDSRRVAGDKEVRAR
jgi:hypothetical protein